MIEHAHSRIAATLLGLVVVSACAHTTAPLGESHRHRLFAEIQVHEASHEEAVSRARQGATCQEQCAGARDARTASTQVCELAVELGDADALMRCEATRRTLPDTQSDGCQCPDR